MHNKRTAATLFKPRSTPKGRRRAAAAVEWKVDQECSPLGGQLVDLSPSGAKLYASTFLPAQREITLRLAAADAGIHLEVPATVCWSRPWKSDRWEIGCLFERELPRDAVEKLAAAGCLERRSDERHLVAKWVEIRWERAREIERVVLVDISTGGFCIRAAEEISLGRRLLLQLALPGSQRTYLHATSRWQQPIQGGYLIGCEFDERQDVSKLLDMVASGPQVAV